MKSLVCFILIGFVWPWNVVFPASPPGPYPNFGLSMTPLNSYAGPGFVFTQPYMNQGISGVSWSYNGTLGNLDTAFLRSQNARYGMLGFACNGPIVWGTLDCTVVYNGVTYFTYHSNGEPGYWSFNMEPCYNNGGSIDICIDPDGGFYIRGNSGASSFGGYTYAGLYITPSNWVKVPGDMVVNVTINCGFVHQVDGCGGVHEFRMWWNPQGAPARIKNTSLISTTRDGTLSGVFRHPATLNAGMTSFNGNLWVVGQTPSTISESGSEDASFSPVYQTLPNTKVTPGLGMTVIESVP